MQIEIDRRQLLLAGLAGAALTLPGCQSLPGFSLTEAIRRLLTLSSQNAFALLLQPNGFYDSQVARIALPDRLGGGAGSGILSAVLQSGAFRDKLQRQLNRAAEKGAERAAPLVAEAVRNVSIEDAASIVRGGPQAASTFLRGKMGSAVLDAMLPGISEGLRLFDDATISRAVQSVSGFDIGALANDITQKADNAVWAAIGAEEANIRANPRSTNDPVLIGVFGLGSALK
ncbi:DUF4197 domain-containing protein [Sphingorhabdus arenilitoris]|uniref:DUF4197 domain-containing protein n=1 Tax=Sphingorhabdus arenilitoris TaxID=1490041 RepID=A0ABV8RHX5_9SPHN